MKRDSEAIHRLRAARVVLVASTFCSVSSPATGVCRPRASPTVECPR